MDSLIEINRTRSFSVNEARTLLPLFYHVTEDAYREVKSLSNRARAFTDKNNPVASSLESKITEVIEKWQAKITKLGGKPKGLWLVDFDNGEGYFCWKYPETEINYWHGYQDGFSGRIMIE